MAVNLSPVGGVAAQFFDNNGVILSGGKIYTYAAGTTTNQATYTSAAGTTAHTNPIILDSAGRVPSGEIWLTDGLQYKFVIKNASDVTIGTYDNIIGINSNFVNFLTETEIQTATAGQTVFTLTTMSYQVGTNNLSVFVDGVNQYDGSTYSYVETDSTTVTFTDGLHVGALVKFTTAQTLSSGSTDSSLVVYNEGGTGAVNTTVQAKLQETVSVKDFGAVGDGVANDAAAFTNAGIAAQNVLVPKGTYLLSSTPTLSSVQLQLDPDSTLNGSGATALGYTTNANRQTLHTNALSTDFSTRYIRRDASYTGGTPGYVCGAFKARTFVGAAATSYEWTIVGICDNSATAGQNVGVYAQGIRRGAAVGPTFGAVAEVYDPTGDANPSFSMVGLEVDCRGNGTDNSNNRVGIDVVVNKQDSGGAANVVSFGVRVQNGGDATATVKTAFSVSATSQVGFDTSGATIQQAAFKMGLNQAIAFDASAVNQLSYDGVGLKYAVSGVAQSRLNNDGSIALNGTQLVIAGTWTTGAQTPTIGANKPGTTGGAPAQWLSISINGNQHWIPAWIN